MKRDRIIELVLGIAGGAALLLLTGIGWLVVQTFDLKGKVSSLDSNLTDTNGRIERMASALPSVAVQVAQRDVRGPAKAVIVATRPTEAAPNSWTSTILVYDLDRAAVTSYTVPLAGANDVGPFIRVRGAALATDRRAVSFEDLSTDLRNMQDTTQIADVIVANSSFVLRSGTANQYMAAFKAMHGSDSARVMRRSAAKTAMTWQSINGELTTHSDKYLHIDEPPTNRDRRY